MDSCDSNSRSTYNDGTDLEYISSVCMFAFQIYILGLIHRQKYHNHRCLCSILLRWNFYALFQGEWRQGVKNNADAVIFYTTNCAAGITISIYRRTESEIQFAFRHKCLQNGGLKWKKKY